MSVTICTNPAMNIFTHVLDSHRCPFWERMNHRMNTKLGKNWRRMTVDPQTRSPLFIWSTPTCVSPIIILLELKIIYSQQTDKLFEYYKLIKILAYNVVQEHTGSKYKNL